jgi:hypothetical protein
MTIEELTETLRRLELSNAWIESHRPESLPRAA